MRVGSYKTAARVSPRLVFVGTLVVVAGLLAASFASAGHVEPVPGPDNAQPSDCPAGSVGYKAEQSGGDVQSGIYGDGTLSVTVTVNSTDDGPTFDFTSNLPIVTAFSKGGPNGSNKYVYDPAVTSDTGLHSPAGPNGDWSGLSHLVFCYQQPPPSESKIIVRKITHPAGDAQSFSFTSDFMGSFSLTHGQEQASGDLEPGTYSVSETPVEGWDLIAAVCDDGSSPSAIDLDEGETVTCQFRNKKRGRIVVKKEANPADTGQSFPFTATWGSFSLAHGEQADSGLLQEGTYSVAEDVPAGWTLTSSTCDDGSSPGSIGLGAGETVTCTFVNTKPAAGRVIVKKIMHGGVGSFDFTGTPSGTISVNEGTLSADVAPGQYVTTEQPEEGWTLISVACDDANSEPNLPTRKATFNVEAGETVTCTFRNKKNSTLIVEKVMEGGQATFDFTGMPAGSISASGGTISATVLDGTYTSTEAAVEGWELVSIDCDDSNSTGNVETRTATFVAAPGETVRCVFTNRKLPEPGSITVRKVTVPAGQTQEFGFQFGQTAFSLSDGESQLFGDLDAGTYSVSESTPQGWFLTSATCDNGDDPAAIDLGQSEDVVCTFTNTKQTTGKGSIDVQKSANPTSLKEPGGDVQYSVRITNPSNVNVTITNVVDDKFGDLDDSGGNGCFDVPINLAPGAFSSCQFTKAITGQGGYEHVNTVCADAVDEFGNQLKDCDDAKVTITPRLIDLVIVKEATSPTKLNGIVNYTLTVTNKGPDTATNVVMADPAPAGIQYQSATPSQGSCAVTPALVTCQLGTLAPGQTVTIAVKGKAIAVGTHVNTATVTGDGGRETNPADNTDSAQTVVPAPVTPPVKPPSKPVVEKCAYLTVTPKMIKADGKKDRVVAIVRSSKRPMKGVKVTVRGGGVRKSAVTNGKGVAVVVVNPSKPGVITITAVNQGDPCGARRIGVVGVFLPPVTG
jgi:uncharacterized repeat protein (TIGR01451 family)